MTQDGFNVVPFPLLWISVKIILYADVLSSQDGGQSSASVIAMVVTVILCVSLMVGLAAVIIYAYRRRTKGKRYTHMYEFQV